jgi:Glycosyl hydrolase family 26
MSHSHARRRHRSRRSMVLVTTAAVVATAAVVVAGPANLLPLGHSDSAGATELGASQAGSLLPPDPDTAADRIYKRTWPRPRATVSPRPSAIPPSSAPAPSTSAPSSSPTAPSGNPGTGSRAGIYWGVVGDPAGAMQRSRQTLANHTYADFTGGVPTDRMVTVRYNSATWPQVTAAQPGSAIYQNIARWADTLKQRGQETLVAYHHEPELPQNERFGDAGQFAQAFQHVVSIFRARGANNVLFVWQMTDWSFRTNSGDREYAAKWYPGDGATDVVGSDAYNWYTCGHGRGRWMQLEALFGPAVAFAKAHGKQAALPEFGSVSDSRRPDWIRAAGQYLADNDQTVVAAFYFNHKPTHVENAECTWPLSSQGDFDALGALASAPMFKS